MSAIHTKKISVVPMMGDVVNQTHTDGREGGDSIIDHGVGKNEESVG